MRITIKRKSNLSKCKILILQTGYRSSKENEEFNRWTAVDKKKLDRFHENLESVQNS